MLFDFFKKPKVETDDQKCIDEVVEMIHILREFCSKFFPNEELLLQIIPRNSDKVNYAPDSNIVYIGLMTHYNETEFENYFKTRDKKHYFHFYSEEFSKGFEGYSIIHFSSDYKSFMAKLNDRVVSEFSDVAFYFDGSRIMHAQKELMDEMKRT